MNNILPKIFIAFTLLLSTTSASAKELIASGNWNNPNIWAPAGVPTSADDVYLQNDQLTLTITGTVNCNLLAVYGATVVFQGTTTLNAGQVLFSSSLSNSNFYATVNLTAPIGNEVHLFNVTSFQNQGTFNLNGGIMRSNNATRLDISNFGTMNINATGDVTQNITIQNAGSGKFYSTATGTTTAAVENSFDVNGIIQAGASNQLIISRSCLNQGIINTVGPITFNGLVYGVGNFSGTNNFTIAASGGIYPSNDSSGYNSRCYTLPKNLYCNGKVRNKVYSSAGCGSNFNTFGYGIITVADTLFLQNSSKLQLDFLFTPSASTIITFMKSTVLIGTFSSVSPALPAGWTLRYNYPASGDVSLEYVTCTNPTVTITPASANVCPGQSVTLTAATNATSPTYQWNTGATTPSITVSPSSNTSYSVTVFSGGCSTTVSKTVNVYPAINLSTTKTDVTCSGGSNGTATAFPSGGNPPYSYSWSNGQMSQMATGLIAGTYTVTVTSATGCTKNTTVTITQPSAITLTTSSTNVVCFGSTTGTASVNATGGIPSYSYLWSNGETTATINNLAAGTYTVTVTDANGCVKTASVTITEPTEIELNISFTNPDCNNPNGGSAFVSVSGGISNYTYSWNNGAITQSISGLSPGVYTVMVTDQNNCTKTASVTLTSPPDLLLTLNTTEVSCNGGSDGSASVIVSGGTPGYTYLWSNGATTASVSNLAADDYSVTVTDTAGCSSNLFFFIDEPSEVVIITTFTNPNCTNPNSGTATVSVSGGTPGYTYLWSNGATTSSISNIAAGTYYITVSDTLGCIKTDSVVLTASPPLVLSTTFSNVTCNGGSNGTATVNVTGGTPGFTYSWNNGATTATISNLIAGNYSVLVTDTLGCSQETNVTITEPSAITLTTTSTNVACNGGSTGSASVSATGGTPGYTYLWSNGATTAMINNLAAGTYTVTVSDTLDCSETSSVTITQPTTIVLTTTSTNVACNGGSTGSASVSATGGTPGYTYLWSNGATTAMINNLAAGTYTVTVSDTLDCSETSSVTITEPSAITLITTSTNVGCNGGSTGSASVSATGGTPGYTYLWSNGATTAMINNLAAGTYTVTVSDTLDCSETSSVTITQPTTIVLTTTSTNVVCNGGSTGSASVSATGGTPGYTYLWSNGATTAIINNLAAGTYTVTVTDATGCEKTASVIITQPSEITLTTTSNNVACNAGTTGTASVTAAGGTPSYGYVWSNGATTSSVSNLAAGTYTVTVTDANGCEKTASVIITQPSEITLTTTSTNVACSGGSTGSASVSAIGGTPGYTYLWSNGAITSSVSNLAGGTYTVTVTDANGCEKTASVIITQPSEITLTTTSTNVACNGGSTGSASVSATGGTPGYTYLWSNGATTSSVSNLAAGTYTVTVTDANGCEKTASIIITQPQQLNASLTVSNITCNEINNGAITAIVNGGTPTYTYLWSNGAATANINNLAAGSYTLNITDANNCQVSATGVVMSPAAITLTSNTIATNCFGSCTGSINLTASGGVQPFTYLWSNGSTTQNITSLCAGTYSVTVKDANNCTKTGTYIVASGPTLLVNLGPDRTLCFAQSTIINPAVNFPNLTYQWTSNNGFTASTATITVSTSGAYYLQVTSTGGCVARDTININATTTPISAEFVIASQAFKDSVVSAFNIALPVPDSIQWVLPVTPGITVLSMSTAKIELKFTQEGTYQIGMRAYRGQCVEFIRKQVLVVTGSGFGVPPRRDPLIKEFTVAPNPTTGPFNAHIVFREITPVRLRLISFATSIVISDRTLSGSLEYNESYNVNAPAGIYIMLLETSRESRIEKIFIQ